MPNSVFAERFTKALKLSGIQQKELAKQIGVHPSNIVQYKKGMYVPNDLNTISKIASILGVSPAWLAGMTDDENVVEPNPKDMMWNKIEKRLSKMDEGQMRKVLKFIEEFL